MINTLKFKFSNKFKSFIRNILDLNALHDFGRVALPELLLQLSQLLHWRVERPADGGLVLLHSHLHGLQLFDLALQLLVLGQQPIVVLHLLQLLTAVAAATTAGSGGGDAVVVGHVEL